MERKQVERVERIVRETVRYRPATAVSRAARPWKGGGGRRAGRYVRWYWTGFTGGSRIRPPG
ncbi:hypothetical protein GCM10009760_12370 [Kitasatospora kazusensis]|uniref:Uncharacterized protein n=1 Tax=Kitasatospora kazusensis TaxID=407974 RepID=A0ABN2Z039_9ACTN